MEYIKKYKYLIFICLGLLMIGGGLYLKYTLESNSLVITSELDDNIEIDNSNSVSMTNDSNEDIVYYLVDIKGAIKSPGVYKADSKSRVMDIINMAGGLTDDADTSLINLSKIITDEMVIIIYTKEEVQNSNIVKTVIKEVESKCVCPNIENDGCINDEITDTIGGSSSEDKININTATIEELTKLSGIGESKANAIIKYREENGEFKSIEDIKNVSGISDKAYEKIKDNITT